MYFYADIIEDSKKVSVVFQRDMLDNSAPKKASIDKVEIVSDRCDKVKYKIAYNNLNETKGYFRISASSMVKDKNYDGFRSQHSPTIIKGSHIVDYEEWITDERVDASTYELWVSIEEIVDNKFNAIIDRVKIKMDKKWDHSCK